MLEEEDEVQQGERAMYLGSKQFKCTEKMMRSEYKVPRSHALPSAYAFSTSGCGGSMCS